MAFHHHSELLLLLQLTHSILPHSVSLFYLVGLFDLWDGIVTLLISAGGTYAIAKYLGASPYMPWIGFVFVMGHMSVSHIHRQLTNDPSLVDITGAQMVLVMKLSAFCWNVADGRLPADQLSESQRSRALKELPPLVDYAAYVLFFPSLFAGPAFDYAEYRRWIDTSMFDVPSQVDPAKKPPVRKKRRIPRSGTPAAAKAVTGLVWIGLFVALSGRYSPALVPTEAFAERSFLQRIWYIHAATVVTRFKFYGVWALTEGACILTGLGYNGVDPVTGKVSWDRLRNVDPWSVEFAQNPRAFMAGWNMNTNNWLRNYIYLRVTPRGKKPGFRASLTTFVTSAFWHGFYPGYYLTFVLASLVQTSAKSKTFPCYSLLEPALLISTDFRRHVRPFFLDPITGGPTPNKKFYDFATYLVTQLTFTFTTLPFLILGFGDSLGAWANVNFYAFAWTLAAMAFFASPGKAVLKRRLESRQGKASARLKRTTSTESLSGMEPILGISKEPDEDIAEAVSEFRAEIAALQKRKTR